MTESATGGVGNAWAKHPHALALYSPEPGDRVRLLVSYGGAWRALLWLKVGKDGSIYVAPRITDVTTVKKGMKKTEQNQVTISYDEGDTVLDAETLKNPKLSFHASGLIRATGDRLRGHNLRELEEQVELCQILFEHPRIREPIAEVRERDICLEYPIDDERPLIGSLLVAPSRRMNPPPVFADAIHCSSMGLRYTGLDEMQDIVVLFALRHGLKGSWPPMTYVTFGYRGDFD